MPRWHATQARAGATGQFDPKSTLRPRQRDVDDDRSGTDELAGDELRRAGTNELAQKTQRNEGGLKVAAPLPECRRSDDGDDAARRRTVAFVGSFTENKRGRGERSSRARS